MSNILFFLHPRDARKKKGADEVTWPWLELLCLYSPLMISFRFRGHLMKSNWMEHQANLEFSSTYTGNPNESNNQSLHEYSDYAVCCHSCLTWGKLTHFFKLSVQWGDWNGKPLSSCLGYTKDSLVFQPKQMNFWGSAFLVIKKKSACVHVLWVGTEVYITHWLHFGPSAKSYV